ncbi:uncharacterized protein LOC135556819 [Oncorhynchus masou masou]|uniref:uncharacterized protein LOC135556819 n=1 Tax=Oncorhynchus masou masou TaxID=90313 RepID=UPI0031842A08
MGRDFNVLNVYGFNDKHDRCTLLEDLQSHMLGRDPLVDREPVCPVRGLAIGEPTTVWRNVAHPALLNRHRDLSWMVAHEILPVRAVMHSRGMARISPCPRPGCGQEESVRHMLWECRAARDLWKEAGPLITSCLSAGEDLTPQLVLYGVGRRPIPSKTFTKLWSTLTCLKEALWSSRNLLVVKNIETTPQAVAMVGTEERGPRPQAKGPPQHPRSRRPRPDSAAAPRAMRLGEGSPLGPEGRNDDPFRRAG